MNDQAIGIAGGRRGHRAGDGAFVDEVRHGRGGFNLERRRIGLVGVGGNGRRAADAHAPLHRQARTADAQVDRGGVHAVIHAVRADRALHDQAEAIIAGAAAVTGPEQAQVNGAGAADRQSRSRAVIGQGRRAFARIDNAVQVQIAGRGRADGRRPQEYAMGHVGLDRHGRSGLLNLGGRGLGLIENSRRGRTGRRAIAGCDDRRIDRQGPVDLTRRLQAHRTGAVAADPAGEHHVAGDLAGGGDADALVAGDADRGRGSQVGDEAGGAKAALDRNAVGTVALHGDRAAGGDIAEEGAQGLDAVAAGALRERRLGDAVAVSGGDEGFAQGDRAAGGDVAGHAGGGLDARRIADVLEGQGAFDGDHIVAVDQDGRAGGRVHHAGGRHIDIARTVADSCRCLLVRRHRGRDGVGRGPGGRSQNQAAQGGKGHGRHQPHAHATTFGLPAEL